MSQNVVNYGIDPSGAQLLDELLSGEQQNRLTMDGGNSRPSYAEIGTIWTDKSVTGKATLKRFNGTSDDVLMTIDETTGAITIPGIADADLSNLSASGNSKFQEPLESGTNIKTINGDSILGSGDLTISAGANIVLTNVPYTTNRILEIPQDIKLELNNGTLTLKAGSKVYVPNGFESDGTTPKFDVIVLEQDCSGTITAGNYKDLFFYYNPTSSVVDFISSRGSTIASGTSYAGNNSFYYHTGDNNCRRTTGSGVQANKQSLFLGICSNDSTGITSIDRIFNGFGYIGSTVFALPMKGQATTAINADGTVTSTIWETTTVQTLTVSASGSVSMSSAGVLTAGFNEVGYTKLAEVTYYDSRVQNVNFYDISFVANSNASNFSQAGKSLLSGIGMPSGRYIDLTLGASGSSYRAPANGYFLVYVYSGNTYTYSRIRNMTTGFERLQPSYGTSSNISILDYPAHKGEVVRIDYTAQNVNFLRFYYAEGEN